MTSFARAAVGTAAVNIGLGVLGAASGVIAARSLGPEARGQLAGGQALGALVATIGALGLAEAVVSKAAGSRTKPMPVLMMGLLLGTMSSVAAVLIAWPLLGLVNLDSTTRSAARWYSVMAVVFVWSGFPGAAFRAIGGFGRWNAIRTIGPLAWLASLTIGAVSGDKSPVLTVQRFLLFQAATVPIGLFLAIRYLPGRYRIDRPLAKPMIRFSLPLALATLPTAFNLRLDQMVLAATGRTEQLGLYATAVAWSLLGAPILVALGSVLFPRIAAISDPTDRKEVVSSGLRTTVLLAVLIGTASAAASPIAIPLLFGSAFGGAVPAAVLLGFAGAVFGVALVAEEVLRGLGRPAGVLAAESVGLLVTVIMLAALIGPLGLTGAAIGSIVGYCGTLTVATWRICRIVDVPPRSLLVPRLDDFLGLVRRMTKSRGARAAGG